ncbi:hypothetical protein NEMBOFW57_002022 [Staphylotrichum longicolle]|uniref:NACHT domain-containing protein n=1 Tax=Staphylotrichum longicolle TaxID=669026 RepID=A0AAD4I1D7_9PEZI|nr:hypothetical protein NEMBOFW57_002022 [Staphylotrichum longicolle]
MDEVNSKAWKLRFGSTEVLVKDSLQPVLGIISRVNDYVACTLGPTPSASMAWAGISLLLPVYANTPANPLMLFLAGSDVLSQLLTNPSEQATSLAKGLEYISGVVAQSRMWEELYVRRYESDASSKKWSSVASLTLESHIEYKSALAMLYLEVLRFQITSYCYYSRSLASRLSLDMIKWNDWTQLLDDVREKERLFNAISETWRDKIFDEECAAAERRHKEALVCWKAVGTELTELRRAVVDAQKESTRAALLDWLCDIDVSEMYNASRDKHRTGTGAWLIEDNEGFQSWETEPCSLLWLYGKGKSILSSSIINYLRERYSSDPTTAVVYFYFTFSDANKQTVVGMLASLLKQLCSRRPTLPSMVQSLLGYKERGERPDAKVLETALVTAMSGFSAVYIIIDALDECPGPPLSRERSKLLGTLCRVVSTRPGNLHLLCTSRRESDIDTVLSPFISAEYGSRRAINLNGECARLNHDIGLYIDSVLASPDFKSWPDEVKAEARSALIERADGMFQYVALQFDALRNLSSMPLIRQALHDLPTGLDATYDRILLSIDPNYRLQVANTLKWLALSERAFRIEEIGHIFIIHPEPPALRWSEQLFDPRDALKYLSGLVHAWTDTESRDLPSDCPPEYQDMGYSATIMRLRVAHFSIKEYLISHRITQGPAAHFGFAEADAHLHIARCCLAYHLQRDATGVSVLKDEELEGYFYELENHLRSSRHWLDKYAAANWPAHLEKVPRERWPLELPLRFTASSGFVQLTDMLISLHEYLTQEDLDNTLKEAADHGQTAVIDLLLDKGAHVIDTQSDDASARAGMGDGSLQSSDNRLCGAAEPIDAEADSFNLLIGDEYGVEKHGNALQRACYRGDSETVQLLLDSGIDVNSQGGYYGTALQAVCARSWKDDVNLVTLLVERGADVNAQGGHFGSALQASCYASNTEVAKKLVESGADTNLFGGRYGSALQASAASSNASILLPMLLSNGADVNQRSGVYGFYGTPLQAAAARESRDALDQLILLLDHGADVNTEGGDYGTALVAAFSHGRGSDDGYNMALSLLRRGASVHAQGGDFGSAWHAAAAKRDRKWEDVLQRMLNGGVDINNTRGQRYATALEAALAVAESATPWEDDYEKKADTNRIRFLLDHGANVNTSTLTLMADYMERHFRLQRIGVKHVQSRRCFNMGPMLTNAEANPGVR